MASRELLVALDLPRPATVSMLVCESNGATSRSTYLQVRHPVLTFTLPLREGFVTVKAVVHSLMSGRCQ
jgi:hypothetical protein